MLKPFPIILSIHFLVQIIYISLLACPYSSYISPRYLFLFLIFRFFATCGQYSRALKLFLQCGDREIDAAIDAVGKSPERERGRLAHQLIDFLVGEKDGIPKDPNYIYR